MIKHRRLRLAAGLDAAARDRLVALMCALDGIEHFNIENDIAEVRYDVMRLDCNAVINLMDQAGPVCDRGFPARCRSALYALQDQNTIGEMQSPFGYLAAIQEIYLKTRHAGNNVSGAENVAD